MSTEYFLEKLQTAQRNLEDADVGLTASAWLEVVYHGWSTASHEKPDWMLREFHAISAIFDEAESLGPDFGGVHVGIFRLSLDKLPRDEFESVRKRTQKFVRDCIDWAHQIIGRTGASGND